MNISLATLNLQGFDSWGTSDTWEKRVPNVVRYVNETKPDIICFQEIVYLPEISPFNPAQLLNQQLNYPFEASSITRLQVGRKYPVYREGLATLSKLTVTKTDTVVLKQAEGDAHNRIVQFIDVRLPDGGMLKIANVHFSITDYVDFAERMRELENVAKSFKGIDKAYAISAGREVRVIVRPENVDDLSAIKLAREIANKVESTMQYPGTIKVNVIRETRAIEFAK